MTPVIDKGNPKLNAEVHLFSLKERNNRNKISRQTTRVRVTFIGKIPQSWKHGFLSLTLFRE